MNFIHYYIQSHLLQMGVTAAQKSNCISLVHSLPLFQSENFVTFSLFSNFRHICLGPALRADLSLLPTPPTSTHRPAFGLMLGPPPVSANTSTCGQMAPPLLKDAPPTTIGTQTAAIALLLKKKKILSCPHGTVLVPFLCSPLQDDCSKELSTLAHCTVSPPVLSRTHSK